MWAGCEHLWDRGKTAVGRIMSWQRDMKTADGIKFANQLIVDGGITLHSLD